MTIEVISSKQCTFCQNIFMIRTKEDLEGFKSYKVLKSKDSTEYRTLWCCKSCQEFIREICKGD